MEYLTPGFKKYISSLRDLPGFEEVNTKLGEAKTGKVVFKILKEFGESLESSEKHAQIGAELTERIVTEDRLRKIQKKSELTPEEAPAEIKPKIKPREEEQIQGLFTGTILEGLEKQVRKWMRLPSETPPSKKKEQEEPSPPVGEQPKKEEPIQTEEQAATAFWAGREEALKEYIKRGRGGKVFQRPVFGPIQLTPLTIKAQEMFDELSSNFQEAAVTLENGSLIITIKNKTYNLSSILPFVEFDHISVSKEALDSYRKLLSSNEFFFKPKCKELSLDKNSEADFEKYFKDQGYEEPADPELKLHLAEKMALNIFTGDAYKIMNPLMRNQMDKLQQNLESQPLNSGVKEALLHLVIAMSGLKKLPPYSPPDMKTKYLWRVEYGDLDFPLEARRRAAAEGGSVGYHLGFLSTSHTKPEPFTGSKVAAGVLIKSTNGKNVSFFSQHPLEREILFAPSLIQWTDAINIKELGGPVFIGHLIKSPQEYAVLYDFDRMHDSFLTLDSADVKKRFSQLPLKTRAAFCAYLIQEKTRALRPIVDGFFQSEDLQEAFTSVDAQNREILLNYAQENKFPIVRQLVRLHAECLATSIQASEILPSASPLATIAALREFMQKNPQLLKQYYERPEVQQKIRDLKKECESRFTPTTLLFSGQDSLNRELLTGTKWNDALRESQVILALFALEAESGAASSLNQELNCLSYGEARTITSMIAEGVKNQHPVVLETLPLNGRFLATPDLGHIQEYIKGKAIDKTFLPIFNALEQAHTKATGKEPPSITQKSLFDIPYSPSSWLAYLNIFNALQKAIHSQEEASLFASESKTPPEALKGQVLAGFEEFCAAENIDPKNMTLPELVEKMARSDALLDQRVSHLMYDRLHLLVALRSPDLTITLKSGDVSIGEIFRKLVEFLASEPKIPNRNALAAEQLYCRIIFLAEKVSNSFPTLISHEELMKYKDESETSAKVRATEIQQQRTEAMREGLRNLVSSSEIRKILADDFDSKLPTIQEIEKADSATLEGYKNHIRTLFKNFYRILPSRDAEILGPISIEDMLTRQDLALDFLKFVHAFHLNDLVSFIDTKAPYVLPTWTRKEYERNAQNVERLINTPEWIQSPHDVHFHIPEETFNPFGGYVFVGFFKMLQKLPNITGISLNLAPCNCAKTLKDFTNYGCSDKIVTLKITQEAHFKGSYEEGWTLPKEVWKLTNLQELSFHNCPALKEIPDDISSLGKLQKLSVEGRLWQRMRLSEEAWRLPKLVELHLDCDTSTSIPEEIASCETLKKLLLKSTSITKFPEAIRPLKNLIFCLLELPRCSETTVSQMAEPVSEEIALARLSFLESFCSSASQEVRDEFYCQTGQELPSTATISKTRRDREVSKLRGADQSQAKQIDQEIGKTLTLLEQSAERLWYVLPEDVHNLYGDLSPKVDLQKPHDILEIFSASHAHNLVAVGEELEVETNDIFNPTKKLITKTALKTKADFLKAQKKVVKRLSEGPAIKKLYLSSKGMTAIPLEVTKLQQLTLLMLDDNLISYVSREIGTLKELQSLALSNNRISTLPKELGNLTNLCRLTLDRNQISEFPQGIGKLTMLQSLSLNANHLRNVSEDTGNLTALKQLYLGYNELQELPRELSKLKNLERLDVCANQLQAFPKQVENFEKLDYLDIAANHFAVSPSQLEKLKNLRSCNVSLQQVKEWPQAEGKGVYEEILLPKANKNVPFLCISLVP